MEDMSFARHAAWYLNNEFTLRKQRRPYYSLRAFARDLSVSPSTLSDLLNSKKGTFRSSSSQSRRNHQTSKRAFRTFCRFTEA